MSLNWYPGHMAKTRNRHQSMLKSIDVILWVVDARAPFSTLDPTLKKTFNNKPFLIVINKKDLVKATYLDDVKTRLSAMDMPCIAISARKEKDVKALIKVAETMKSSRRKIGGLRLSVLGIPNTGKSTLINQLAKKKTQAVANTPGITKALRWVETGDVSILDTPGVLWPKIEDPIVGIKMAILGSIKDKIIPYAAALDFLFERLMTHPESKLSHLYPGLSALEITEKIAHEEGFKTDHSYDEMALTQRLLKGYREGEFGKVPLDD